MSDAANNQVRQVHIPFSAADMEPDLGHGPVEKEGHAGLDSRCRIEIISYRHRLADADGISAKALIDGLILAEILPDDSPKYVKEVGFSQVKIGKDEMERTEVIISRVEV